MAKADDRHDSSGSRGVRMRVDGAGVRIRVDARVRWRTIAAGAAATAAAMTGLHLGPAITPVGSTSSPPAVIQQVR